MKFNMKKRIVWFQVPPYKKRWLASLTALGFLVLTSIISFYIVDFRIRPTLVQLVRVAAHKTAIQAINDSIRANISPDIEYQSLIRMQLDSEGRVTFFQPNTGAINRIASEATLAVQKRLTGLPRQEVKIPLWQVFGSKILAGYGPELPVRITPVGLVDSTINDRFDAAGINQTRHRIFIRITAIIRVIVPLVHEEVAVTSDIPLTEAVIVGAVPGVYVHGGSGVIVPGNPNPPGK
jgi:sporulation protein YunB